MTLQQRYRVTVKPTTTEVIARSLALATDMAHQIALLQIETNPICPRCKEPIENGQIPRFDGTVFSGLIYHYDCLTKIREAQNGGGA